MNQSDSDFPAEAQLLDQAALDSIRALQQPGQPDLLAKIIDTYLESAEALIEALRRSLDDGDTELLRRSAHSLKSSSASLGAMRFSALCRQLEMDVREGGMDHTGTLVERISEEYESSSVALRQERDRSRADGG